MHRSAPRLTRLLACAAVVPVMLVAGCSSDSGKEGGDEPEKPASSSPSASVAPAKYRTLPQPCKALGKGTVEKLVPKAKNKSGTAGKSSDTDTRGSCSWNGLDGFQYRWMDVSLQRLDSDQALGTAAARAKDQYGKQVSTARAAADAKNVKAAPAAGVGDEATTISYDLKKDGDDFRNQTVVVLTENVVITLNYNGAGYESGKTPKAGDMAKDAEGAAKEVVKAIAEANA